MPNPLIAAVGGSVGSAVVSKKASDKATDASVAASEDANALQKYIYDNNVAMTQDQRIAGGNALQALQRELGLPEGEFQSYGAKPVQDTVQDQATPIVQTVGGLSDEWLGEPNGTGNGFAGSQAVSQGQPANFTQSTVSKPISNSITTPEGATAGGATTADGTPYVYKGYEASKGYLAQLEEGTNAIDRRNSANGSRLGGAALKEAMRFNQGLAAQDYGNYYNRLASMAGMGQTAVNSQAAAGQNYANAYGANVNNAASARASGYENNAAIFNNTTGNLMDIYGAYKGGYFQ